MMVYQSPAPTYLYQKDTIVGTWPLDDLNARPKGTNRGYMVEWNFYDRARSSSMRVTWCAMTIRT